MSGNPAAEWVERWIAQRLDRGRWCYHGLEHTRFVAADAVEFGRFAGVGASDLHLLETAGWMHDVGYVTDPEHHEEASAEIVRNVLPGLGFSEEETRRTAELVLATRLSGVPGNLLEELIRDADLGRLGSADFWPLQQLLRRELAAGGQLFTDLEWFRYELRFLDYVRYSSAAARELRGAGLEKNRKLLRDKVRSLEEEGTR